MTPILSASADASGVRLWRPGDKIPTLICVCGEVWSGPVPRKFRTQSFMDLHLRAWKARHDVHLKKVK